MSRFIAVGDIHGCSQTLARMLEILDLGPDDTLLSTGDLSSKGEDSRGVHQQFIDLQQRGVRVIILLGNHELMLLAMQRALGADVDLGNFPERLFEGADTSFLMRENETWATLKSYGLPGAETPELWAFRRDDPRQRLETVIQHLEPSDWLLPQDHLDLLCSCKTHHVERNCLFIHSGLDPVNLKMVNVQHAIEAQLAADAREICWTRSWLGKRPGFPELIVHGHTPLSYLHSYVPDTTPWRDQELVFKSVVHDGALNLDSGVFLESGHLTAVEIPESSAPEAIEFIRVPRIDPVCKDRLWHFNYR